MLSVRAYSYIFQWSDKPGFKECIENAGLELSHMKDVMHKLNAGEALDAGVQKKVGCSQHCMLEKRGLWKDEGVDIKAFEGKFTEFRRFKFMPNPKKAVQECAAIKGADKCDTAFQVLQCFRKKVPK